MTIDTTPDHIRALIARAGISQREVARRMEINDRTVRRYCKYGGTVQYVMALEWIASHGDGAKLEAKVMNGKDYRTRTL